MRPAKVVEWVVCVVVETVVVGASCVGAVERRVDGGIAPLDMRVECCTVPVSAPYMTVAGAAASAGRCASGVMGW